MLIIRRSKLYYSASGIVTLCRWPSGAQVERGLESSLNLCTGRHAVAQLVEALRYKPEGRVFDSRWCHWNFFSHNPSDRSMALGSTRSTQLLTEMSTRSISRE